jgi:TIGR01244 family protein
MPLKLLEDDVFVSAQISISEIQEISAQGVKTIIVNRPDHEDPGQPSVQDVKDACQGYDIQVHHLPFVSGGLSPEIVEIFADICQQHEGALLAYCRSGTRSTHAWAFARVAELGVKRVIEQAKKAGYDLSTLRPLLEQMVN